MGRSDEELQRDLNQIFQEVGLDETQMKASLTSQRSTCPLSFGVDERRKRKNRYGHLAPQSEWRICLDVTESPDSNQRLSGHARGG